MPVPPALASVPPSAPAVSLPSPSVVPLVVAPPPVNEIQTIVIDPGHGGDAPGAIGPTGLTEAEVVLDVSFMVKRRIEERLNKKVLLTRDRDTSVALHDRTKMANDQKADLFVSIHANASPKRSVRGVETYLFGRATNTAALATAARENATNVETTKNFQDVILSDLLRDFTLNESLELAHYTQESFVKTLFPLYDTKSLGVKKAPFYVLAHTNMPAILAEISFISNRVEEGRLRQNSYREKIAESIFQGIKAYIKEKQ
jgi:N-acetylmuramoyl-L-alanine amidase